MYKRSACSMVEPQGLISSPLFLSSALSIFHLHLLLPLTHSKHAVAIVRLCLRRPGLVCTGVSLSRSEHLPRIRHLSISCAGVFVAFGAMVRRRRCRCERHASPPIPSCRFLSSSMVSFVIARVHARAFDSNSEVRPCQVGCSDFFSIGVAQAGRNLADWG